MSRATCLIQTVGMCHSTEVSAELTREEYNKQYKEYEKRLHEFRMHVKQEMNAKKEEHDRLKVEKQDTNSVQEQQRLLAREEKLKQKTFLNYQKQQELTQARELRKAGSFKREALRRKLIQEAEDERYKWLLNESRSWITRAKLDERIQSALDSPVTLY